jgi:hypothetical protein
MKPEWSKEDDIRQMTEQKHPRKRPPATETPIKTELPYIPFTPKSKQRAKIRNKKEDFLFLR